MEILSGDSQWKPSYNSVPLYSTRSIHLAYPQHTQRLGTHAKCPVRYIIECFLIKTSHFKLHLSNFRFFFDFFSSHHQFTSQSTFGKLLRFPQTTQFDFVLSNSPFVFWFSLPVHISTTTRFSLIHFVIHLHPPAHQTTKMASTAEVQRLQDLANQLRILSIQSTDASKSG